MKIGFDAKRAFHNFSGLGNYSRDLIDHLSTFYPEDEFFAFSANPKPNARTQFLFDRKNVKIVSPKSIWNKALPSIWRSFNMENSLLENDVEIFHGLSNEIPKRSSSSVPFLVTIHDVIFKRYPEYYKPADRKIYDRKWKYSCENSDLVIAISEQTKSDLISFYGIKEEKIKVIYQSCHQAFRESSSIEIKNAVKERFDLPTDFVLSVGTIEERKNLENVIRGLALAKNKIPLVIVGRKTDYFQKISNLIAENKSNLENVIFIENITMKELAALYKLAKTFLYTSHFEGFGIPIIEALYSKTPIISSAGGCFSEAGGPDSKYVNPADPSELAFVLDSILEDSDLVNSMTEKGYLFVQDFNPEVLSKQLMDLYKTLA